MNPCHLVPKYKTPIRITQQKEKPKYYLYKTKRLLKNDQNSVMTKAKLKAISSSDTNPTPGQI